VSPCPADAFIRQIALGFPREGCHRLSGIGDLDERFPLPPPEANDHHPAAAGADKVLTICAVKRIADLLAWCRCGGSLNNHAQVTNLRRSHVF